MQQFSSHMHPARAPQVVLCGDLRLAKRRTSGFITKAGNFHHFKTPVTYLVSLILIEEPTFWHPSLEIVWLNSQVFLLLHLPVIFNFEKEDLLIMKFPMRTPFLAHLYHAHMNIVEKNENLILHLCNYAIYNILRLKISCPGCSLACNR